MPLLEDPVNAADTAAGLEPPLGLFRRETLPTGPVRTVTNLFTNLRDVSRGEIIAEHPERHLQGTRLHIDRDQGHGMWEFYRLDQDFYVVAADGVYHLPRIETVPGEGLIEFHLRLSGMLEITLPGCGQPVLVTGPTLLVLYQPPGVDISERVKPKLRETGVSLYCRPQFLRDLARRSGIARWALLEEIERHPSRSVWHRQLTLSSTLRNIAASLLENTYRCGVRLLHAEAKALEVLCDVLASAQAHGQPSSLPASACETRQLNAARRLLAANLTDPMRICDVARAVGMSETKLRRVFKARLGVTVFAYALECRMQHALDLLRVKQMSVGQAAHAIGYRHQASFAAAFQEYFGFLPSKARTGMH
jgi:AraC-like DNA-binding protein